MGENTPVRVNAPVRVNTLSAGDEVADQARGDQRQGQRDAEKFDPHHDAGPGRFGRTGEDGHQTQGREKVVRLAEDRGECVAQCRADAKERRDLAPFETGTERYRGEG